MGWYFAFFFLSGFCSILYELIWLRLSMAQFGVTTAQVSIILSTFMAGMGLGSWGAGELLRRYGHRITASPIRLYALIEFLIGVASVTVPEELLLGHKIVGSIEGQTALSSTGFYLAAGLLVAAILLPWCACMGATIPVAMHAIRTGSRDRSHRSFSFLYVANVIGAVAGAVVPLLLIEERGFHKTLEVGAVLNLTIAALAFSMSFWQPNRIAEVASQDIASVASVRRQGNNALVLLFLTGLVTMGAEVVWIRTFTPYLGPVVYSLASILACYLLATFAGSLLYRTSKPSSERSIQVMWVLLGLVGLLPLLTGDPRFGIEPLARVVLGVVPFSVLIGSLTPMLVDRWSGGDPHRAGLAYAVNVAGCIVGPLLAGFVLLPLAGEHASLLILALPWTVMAIPGVQSRKTERGTTMAGAIIIAMSLALFFFTKDFETRYARRVVLRDSTATVIAAGTGMRRSLITNGVGMTILTPITKMMAHLALGSLDRQPQNALVICFGMGTTYRSVLSWGVSGTAVELVPSVPRLFSYYHEDGNLLLKSPLSHVIIDDGRRFLERSQGKFDAIIVDPPPPAQAATSSLLYSEEFYALAKQHLEPDGILAQWLPGGGDAMLEASVARALSDAFPYVRAFKPLPETVAQAKSREGWHFLARMRPISHQTAVEFVRHMPAKAIRDMMEWGPATTPEEQFEIILSSETKPGELIARVPEAPALRDDRPVNEYFILRTILGAPDRTGTR